MNSFNPSKYSSASGELYESNIEVNNEIVEKGHKNIMKVDIIKFEELCKIFKDKTNLKIKKLSGEDKENFDLMVNYVHLLYGTSYYNKLFEKAKKHFKNSTVKPGTVGGYFAGCLSKSDKGKDELQSGCAVACAGSMPLPKDEDGWSFCDKAVLMAEKSGDGYVFSVVKPAENDEDYDPAYLFIDGEFSGFTAEEKTELRNLGCDRVKLISYDDNMNYHELFSDPKSLSEVAERKIEKVKRDKKVEKSKHHETEDNYNWFILLIFLVLIILFLYLVYHYYKLKY